MPVRQSVVDRVIALRAANMRGHDGGVVIATSLGFPIVRPREDMRIQDSNDPFFYRNFPNSYL